MQAQPLKDITSEGLRGRLALPDHAMKAGIGVLVLPSVSGLAGMTAVLTQLGEAGLPALAWDPFSTYDAGIDQKEKARIAEQVQQDAVVVNEHKHWVGYMQKELGLARIAALGFCMGGRMLLLAAQDTRIAAVAAYYPTLRGDPRWWSTPCRSWAAHLPGAGALSADALTSHASRALRAALEAGNREHRLISTRTRATALSRAGERPSGAAAGAIRLASDLSFLGGAIRVPVVRPYRRTAYSGLMPPPSPRPRGYLVLHVLNVVPSRSQPVPCAIPVRRVARAGLAMAD
jgi:dienelactone hydrolase